MSTVRAVTTGLLIAIAWPLVGRADEMTVVSNTGSWTYFFDPSTLIEKYFNQTSNTQAVTNSDAASAQGTSSAGTNTSSADSTSSQVVASTMNNSTTSTSGSTGATSTSSVGGGSTGNGSPVADAFLNFVTTGNAPEASSLTVGNAQPWYDSPAVIGAFGHVPTSAEQTSFASTVLADVKETYALAGLSPNVTTDPTVTANHTISIVSGLSYGPNANAIGITDVGHDGFGFIDKLNYASNPTDLAWAVAHNVSHELMHAFGVAIHADQTGQYVDAAAATWSLLTNPQATFSPAAATLIANTNFGPSVTTASQGTEGTGLQIDGDQEVMAVPEPMSLAAWSLVVVGVLYNRSRTANSKSAA